MQSSRILIPRRIKRVNNVSTRDNGIALVSAYQVVGLDSERDVSDDNVRPRIEISRNGGRGPSNKLKIVRSTFPLERPRLLLLYGLVSREVKPQPQGLFIRHPVFSLQRDGRMPEKKEGQLKWMASNEPSRTTSPFQAPQLRKQLEEVANSRRQVRQT